MIAPPLLPAPPGISSPAGAAEVYGRGRPTSFPRSCGRSQTTSPGARLNPPPGITTGPPSTVQRRGSCGRRTDPALRERGLAKEWLLRMIERTPLPGAGALGALGVRGAAADRHHPRGARRPEAATGAELEPEQLRRAEALSSLREGPCPWIPRDLARRSVVEAVRREVPSASRATSRRRAVVGNLRLNQGEVTRSLVESRGGAAPTRSPASRPGQLDSGSTSSWPSSAAAAATSLALVDVDGLARIQEPTGARRRSDAGGGRRGATPRSRRRPGLPARGGRFAISLPHRRGGPGADGEPHRGAGRELSVGRQAADRDRRRGRLVPADGSAERLLESAAEATPRPRPRARRSAAVRPAPETACKTASAHRATLVEPARTCDPRPSRVWDQDQRGSQNARRQHEHVAQLGAAARLPAARPHRATTASTSSRGRGAAALRETTTSPAQSVARPRPRPCLRRRPGRRLRSLRRGPADQGSEPRGALGRAHRLRAAPARPRARRAGATRTPARARAAGPRGGCTVAPRRQCDPRRGRPAFDSGSPSASRPGGKTQALELFLHRAGLRVLLLSARLAEARFEAPCARSPPRRS